MIITACNDRHLTGELPGNGILMQGLAGGLGLAVALLDGVGKTGLDTIVTLLGIGLFLLARWISIADVT
jgi:hypothetical protein